MKTLYAHISIYFSKKMKICYVFTRITFKYLIRDFLTLYRIMYIIYPIFSASNAYSQQLSQWEIQPIYGVCNLSQNQTNLM